MANRRFIDFPIASTVGDSDIILIWQGGANKQTTKATFLSGLPENLDELNDVAISGLTNGQILRYDSVTGKWENTDQGNLDLNDLNDVSIVSPSNGQVLVYNSSTSKWENSSGGYVPYTGAVTTVNLGAQTIQAGQFVKAGGTAAQFLKADGSVDSNTYGTGTVTSVALTMPSAFNVANSPITTAGTLAVTGAGTVGQYIRGDGSLADFPQASGGGSSVSYYLNGSISQGTIGGVAYKELNKVPILGAGTDFTINANGYIASFLTDAGDPNLLEIPGGNWNFETYFSASSSGGSPSFYVELYKYNGTTFTLIASSSSSPELIAFGTNLNPYFSTLAVPTTTLALTDRLAIRYYVTHSGRTITLHTENNHLCQVVTTFTTGLTSLNGLTAQVQNLAVGTSGTDFNIASATATHTFNLPTASATNRGALSSADWTTFNNKQNALTLTTSGSSGASTLVGATLNVPTYTLSGLGGVPTSRQLTINGTAFDLSADRSWSVGTVTSVGLSSATSGVTIGSTPVTTSGTITLAIATATSTQQGLLSSTDWSTFNNKQNAITLTTTGTSGAATLVGATLNIPQYQAAGTYVTSVTASSPLASSGGTTPNITIQQASGAQSGFLSSTDWTTFNSKQNALTNPVTGTGSAGQIAYFSGTSAISSESNLFWDATNDRLGIGTNTPSYNLSIVGGTSAAVVSAFQNTSISGYSGAHLLNNSGVLMGHFGYANASTTAFSDLVFFGSIASKAVIFTTADTEKMRIFAGGNVHIGTTPASDNGARLQVSGTATFSGNVTTNKIGVGGASPTYSITAYNASNGTTAAFGGTARGIRIDNDGTFSSGRSTIYGVDSSFYGSYQPLSIEASSLALQAVTGGNVLIGTTTDNGAKLQVSGAATFSSSVTANGAIKLQTPANGTNAINFGTSATNYHTITYDDATGKLNFNTDGTTRVVSFLNTNVGIGTTSPDTFSYGGARSFLTFRANGTNQEPFFQLIANGVGNSLIDFGNTTIRRATILGENGSNLVFYTNGSNSGTSVTERMRITSVGRGLFGTQTASAGANGFAANSFQVKDEIVSIGSTAGIFWENRSGGVTASSNWYGWYTTGGVIYLYNGAANIASINTSTGAYTALSDINKKENFEASEIGLKEVLNLKPTIYSIKNDAKKERHLGFIAQEVKQYIPNAYVESDGFIGLNEMPIIAALTKAIQELKQEIDTLKN